MYLKILLSLLFSFFLLNNSAYSQATLEAPIDIKAGAEFKVLWTGPNNKGDFITIVKAEAKEKRYGKYKYTKKGTPLILRAPDEAGNYEIRYLDGKSRETISSLPVIVTPASASIEAPPDAVAGSTIKIKWSGPDNKGDFITIVKEGSEERTYGKYSYTRKGNPLKLKAPDDAGNYEIRYLSGQKYYTLASVPINILATTAYIDVPPEVIAGAEIKINWEGPDNDGDFITIVEEGAEERSYGRYVYTRRGNPLKLKVPDEAGIYEVRYLTGQKYKTLASLPITINPTSATLDFAPEATAGSELKVTWTGPDNNGDFITIVKAGEEEKKYETYVYTKKGNPLKITVPDEEGSYEVRYLTAQNYNTLENMPLIVVPPSATLEAPPQVVVNDTFEVAWTGPDNKGDFIGIFDSGVEEAKYKSYAYTRRGNPLKIKAPETPGVHEIKYLMGQSRKTLATIKLDIIESKIPGTLKVVSAATGNNTASSASFGAVELILDASGSMLKILNGYPRIDIAKEAVTNLIQSSLQPGTPFAMRVFGHIDSDSCRTDLEIPLNPLDVSSAISKINSINAKNLAKTPIAKSLKLVSDDLAGIEGKAVIVLVTDGEETCEGDPKSAIQSLKDSGYDVRVNIVGFAIDVPELKETFREWANIGNGSYFDAGNAEELGKSIQKAIEIPFEVLNAENDLVATGVLNGDAVELPAGNYSIKVLGSKTTTISNVTVDPEKEKVVTFE